MNNITQVNIQYLPSAEEIDSSKPLMAGGFLWPGFSHSYPVFSKKLSGNKYRYQTGLVLDEVSEDKKEEIEQAIKELETYYGVGTVSDPFNDTFWKDIKLDIKRKNILLDIKNNMEHKLLYYVIKGGGIFEVASSYDDAVDQAIQKRWFMVEPEHYADLSAMSDRVINKAVAALEQLDEEKQFMDMFLVHKVLISSDRGVVKNTPKSTLYKDLSDFVHGRLSKSDKRKAPKLFLDTFNLIKDDKKKLTITALVKDASYYNFLITSEDGNLTNINTKTKYGSTLAKAIEYLSNPANEHELENVKEHVEKKWSE